MTLLALAGCATQPPPHDWSRLSMRDLHQHVVGVAPAAARPAAVVTAGPTGLLVGAGAAAPATRIVADGAQLRLVSEETFARIQAAPTGAMGAPAR
jgi:hypothetical protein